MNGCRWPLTQRTITNRFVLCGMRLSSGHLRLANKREPHSRRSLCLPASNSKIEELDFERDFYPAIMEALFRSESWIAIVMITDLLARKYRFNVPGTKANLNWTRRMQRSIAQLGSSRKERKRMELIHELLVKAGRVEVRIDGATSRTFRRSLKCCQCMRCPVSAPAQVAIAMRRRPRAEDSATLQIAIHYALFSIGAPTLLPHSVHEPS